MGEHSLRYASLAESLVDASFVVYANDHRGHGLTVKDASQLGDYGPEGWRGLVDDELRLVHISRERHAVPVFIMGHSMGSTVIIRAIALAAKYDLPQEQWRRSGGGHGQWISL